MPIRVTIWNEGRHEKKDPKIGAIYPEGIHGALAAGLKHAGDFAITTATLDEPENGLTDERLANTDVWIWWGHMAHNEVNDAGVEKLRKRILAGAGLIVLHSGHFSKIFQRLMGTTCNLKWRVSDDRETLWVTRPGHPIVKDIDDHIVLEKEEMYGEFFDIPEPEETILISSFTGGEVFRSGCTWRRGAGRIFYFRPGHETYPTYHNPQILKVIENAVRWVAPSPEMPAIKFGKRPLPS